LPISNPLKNTDLILFIGDLITYFNIPVNIKIIAKMKRSPRVDFTIRPRIIVVKRFSTIKLIIDKFRPYLRPDFVETDVRINMLTQ
jgi:hypothetical protein